MEQNNKWSSAAMDGLYLSLVTIIYSLVASAFPTESFLIKTLLWIIKFGGCLYLLWFFMKRWSDQFETISYSQSYNYGFIVCLLSSVMCACYTYAQVEWIFPGQTEQAIILAKETMAQQGSLNSSTENMMNAFFSNFGRISLFVTLIYYTLFGAVAAAITANFTKKTNPFGDVNNE